MRRVHGVRLRDFWRGDVTPRELFSLIHFLPVDSEFVRALDPDGADRATWDVNAHLLAVLIDQHAAAHFKNPKPIPRPQELIETRKRRERQIAALAAQNERIQARNQLTEGDASGNR